MELPELQALSSVPLSVDLTVYCGALPPDASQEWRHHPRFTSRRHVDYTVGTWLRIWESADGCYTRLSYRDGVELILDQTAQNLWVNAPQEFDAGYIDSYLVNQGLGFVLRMRGVTCLHASAFMVDGRAVLVSAPSGTGKSTLASYFAAQGHPIIADDISALSVQNDAVDVQPGYPRLRLKPTAANALFGEDQSLTRMAEGWDKFYLSLNDDKYDFAQEAVPIRAVYLLKKSESPPKIEPISLAESLFALMENTYLSYLIDAPIYAADFQIIGQLLNRSKVRWLYRSSDLTEIDQLYRLILDDLNTA